MTAYGDTQQLQPCACPGAPLPTEWYGRALGALGLLVAAMTLAVGVAAIPPGADQDAARSQPEVVLSLSARPSHGGLYRAEVIDHAGSWEPGGRHSWIVRVDHADGTPVSGATIRPGAWMPATGEHPSVQPSASTDLGGGRYRIEGLRFPEAGWWSVPLQITSGTGVDSLAFNLVVPEGAGSVAVARSTGGAS